MLFKEAYQIINNLLVAVRGIMRLGGGFLIWGYQVGCFSKEFFIVYGVCDEG
jgi:hypothetical protein